MSAGLRILSTAAALFLYTSASPALPQEQVLKPPSEVQTGETTTAPKQGESTAPGPEQAGAAEEQRKAEGGVYIIKEGDTLWDISSSFFRDPFLWPLLWKANPSILNPDLIYPGVGLSVPSLAPIERAMERPEKVAEEKAVEEKFPRERAAQEKPVQEVEREVAVAEVEAEPAPPPLLQKKPAEPEPVEEEAPAPKRILILPEEKAVPVMDKYSMLNAGFVNADETEDRIVGSLEPKTIFGYDDVVYINVHAPEAVKAGDRFLIYVPLKKVKHPATKEVYGRLIKVLGVLKVVSTENPEAITTRITLSFDSISKGSRLTPYQEPSLVYDSPRKDKSLSGHILEVIDGRTLNAMTDIVYLDKGSADGVEQGDRFIVYLEPEENFPRKVIGELQVFLVKERSSTAVVRKSVDTMARGDKIEYRK